MMNEYFERELNLIENERLREVVSSYFNCVVPAYFWHIGASASGKYHPQFSQGEGGLARHTKAVVMFAEELMRMSTYAYLPQAYKDYIVAACLIHDTAKHGLEDKMEKGCYKFHGRAAAEAFAEFALDSCGYHAPEKLLDAVRTHMGQWSPDGDKPFSPIDRCVHMADYMASRPFIDIPDLH